MKVTRRDALTASGLALSGLALGGIRPGTARAQDQTYDPARAYTYFDHLDEFTPGTPLEPSEMRITFLGSGFPTPRRAQAEMSIFVEVGPWVIPDSQNNAGFGRAKDSFVFDLGSGATTNYAAMNISPSRMDKVFLTHLHGDHLNDLAHLYHFGPSMDRKSPQYVWGPRRSGITCPAWGTIPPTDYDDGTRAFCADLRNALRWATESFSFQTTNRTDWSDPMPGWVVPDRRGPVADDPPYDAYALVPIELDWTKYGKTPGDNIAYYNPATRVKITHFPVIHCRKGSIGYKLEWDSPYGPLSMVFTGDTKPEHHSISQGSGVDVFIHEMILPADYLSMKTMHLNDPKQVPKWVLDAATIVQNSSHTPQGAFGYLLSKMKPAPRLAVATHFTVSDDTVDLAMNSLKGHVPGIVCETSGEILDGGKHPKPGTGQITWSTDLMVLRVFPDKILVRKGVVNDYAYQPYPGAQYQDQGTPKYDDGDPSTLYGDAYAQIDTTEAIVSTEEGGEKGKPTYRKDGY